MPCVLAAPFAELFELKPSRGGLLVLCGRVIPLFAIAALQRNYFSHKTSPFPYCQNCQDCLFLPKLF
jgi:hypothetical protein